MSITNLWSYNLVLKQPTLDVLHLLLSLLLISLLSCSNECNGFIDNSPLPRTVKHQSFLVLKHLLLEVYWYNEARQCNVFPGLVNNKSNKKKYILQLCPASSLISRNLDWARRSWALYTLALSALQSTLQPVVLFPYSPIRHPDTMTPSHPQ